MEFKLADADADADDVATTTASSDSDTHPLESKHRPKGGGGRMKIPLHAHEVEEWLRVQQQEHLTIPQPIAAALASELGLHGVKCHGVLEQVLFESQWFGHPRTIAHYLDSLYPKQRQVYVHPCRPLVVHVDDRGKIVRSSRKSRFERNVKAAREAKIPQIAIFILHAHTSTWTLAIREIATGALLFFSSNSSGHTAPPSDALIQHLGGEGKVTNVSCALVSSMPIFISVRGQTQTWNLVLLCALEAAGAKSAGDVISKVTSLAGRPSELRSVQYYVTCAIMSYMLQQWQSKPVLYRSVHVRRVVRVLQDKPSSSSGGGGMKVVVYETLT